MVCINKPSKFDANANTSKQWWILKAIWNFMMRGKMFFPLKKKKKIGKCNLAQRWWWKSAVECCLASQKIDRSLRSCFKHYKVENILLKPIHKVPLPSWLLKRPPPKVFTPAIDVQECSLQHGYAFIISLIWSPCKNIKVSYFIMVRVFHGFFLAWRVSNRSLT